MRTIWEDAPSPLRRFLHVGWRYGLGLRLAVPPTAADVLGWNVYENAPERIAVDAHSRILYATNTVTVTVTVDQIQWDTTVTYKNVLGRVLWAAARIVHERLVPSSIRRAVRDAPRRDA